MGDIVLQTHYDEGKATYLTVIRADRNVLISHQLLCSILGDPMFARLVLHQHECTRSAPCFYGALLHIDARNRHLGYRIGDYENDCWEAALEYDSTSLWGEVTDES